MTHQQTGRPDITNTEAEVFFPDISDDGEELPKCPACHGTGMVNPLTDPKQLPPDFFCAGATECPMCDGTGECP